MRENPIKWNDFMIQKKKMVSTFNLPLNSNQPLFPIVPFFFYDKIFSTGVSIPVKCQKIIVDCVMFSQTFIVPSNLLKKIKTLPLLQYNNFRLWITWLLHSTYILN